jgi:hypothetical protein
MGTRTPDLLIANETLYQLSYTPNLIDFNELHDNLRNTKRCLSIPAQADEGKRHRQRRQVERQPTSRRIPNVPCLKRHEINGNYYPIKKIRSKIKAVARSARKAASPVQL